MKILEACREMWLIFFITGLACTIMLLAIIAPKPGYYLTAEQLEMLEAGWRIEIQPGKVLKLERIGGS